jgi:hypothetical protein
LTNIEASPRASRAANGQQTSETSVAQPCGSGSTKRPNQA